MAAAAAVVIVVVGSVAAGSWLARSGNGQSSNPAAPKQRASAGSFTGVPAYYVAVENPSLAVVRATATGATLARVTTRTPFVGVTGAADDRTFVLDAQRQVMGPTVQWPGQPAFYLLRLSAAGAEESFTRLTIPALPKGTAVTGLALSPDGSKLAVEVDSGNNGQPGLLEVTVYTLATGAFRTWSTHGSDDPVDPGGFTGSGVDGSQTISWAADSTTLAFDWGNQTYIGVRLLDTAASGDNLIADSRLAVIEANFTSQGMGLTSPLDIKRQHLPVRDGWDYLTGRLRDRPRLHDEHGWPRDDDGIHPVLNHDREADSRPRRIPVPGPGAGRYLFVLDQLDGEDLDRGVLTPSGIRVGVINSERFTPLPGIAGLGAAAW